MTNTQKSQATMLVELAEDHFTFGRASSGEPFAVPKSHYGPPVVRMLRGGRDSLRAELAYLYIEQEHKAPGAGALADALLVIEGRAQRSTPIELHLRVARDREGRVVLDLGNDEGQTVVIHGGRWWVTSAAPVYFRRTELSAPLPVPVDGGRLEDLSGLLNISKAAWPLLVAYLVAALIPEIPHPVLLLLGEQGTGKTTVASALARLVDPSPAQVRTAPRDVEGWAVTASGSWVVALDNVSSVSEWLSDAICRAATGDGLVRRRLYSDSNLSVLNFRRVVMLTSIDAGALRGDLADRLVLGECERIEETARLTDAEIQARFKALHPSILGALLDLTAEVLEVLPTIKLERLPRMADFARVVAAVDHVLGTSAFELYVGSRRRLADEVIEGDEVAQAIRALAVRTWDGQRQGWVGTSAELLAAVVKPENPPKGWPTTPRGMAGALKRVSPALREVGVSVEHHRDGQRREVVLTWSPEKGRGTSSSSSQPSPSQVGAMTVGDGRDPNHDGCEDQGPKTQARNDGHDGCDGHSALISDVLDRPTIGAVRRGSNV